MRRTEFSTAARSGGGLVSTTVLALRKPYSPALFDQAARELDRVAAKLVAEARGKLTESATATIAGQQARTYRYTTSAYEARIGFVLNGRREYELYCRNAGYACGLLFSSFTLRQPTRR